LYLQLAQAATETASANVFEQLWAGMADRAVSGSLNFFEQIYKEIYINLISQDRYLDYLKGMGVTVQVSLAAGIIGALLGVIIALMRLSNVKILGVNPLSKIATWYVGLIRGTPLLLQVVLINYAVFQSIRIDKILVGVIACSLNSAAYVSEIIRGGIQSVDKGQIEAGRSLGLTSGKTMWLIVLPQAFKIALPSICNEFIVLIKETSVLAYIAVTELTKAGDYIRSRTYSAFTPYLVVGILYLLMTGILSKLLGKLERRLREGDNR
jgi:amine acid ABC transporter, permease protein, 3-TM region, His/Glu/Gln/Arg/opine family